jgi:hypothetical protein
MWLAMQHVALGVCFAMVSTAHAAPAPPTSKPHTAVIDLPVAFVSQQPVWQSELDDCVRRLPLPHDAATIDRALDELIDDTLLVHAAQEQGIVVSDAEIDGAITEIETQEHLDEAGFKQALAAVKLTMSQYRDILRRQLLAASFVRGTLIPGSLPFDQDALTKQFETAQAGWLRARRKDGHLVKRALQQLEIPGGSVAAVDVQHPDRALAERARGALASQLGKPIDRALLRTSIAETFRWGNVADARLTAAAAADGLRLTVTLVPQPLVRGVALREAGGADMMLPGELGALVGHALDPAALDRAAVALRERYVDHGYVDAAVEWLASPTAGQVDVTVMLTTGNPVTFDGVELHGESERYHAALVQLVAQDCPTGTPWLSDHVERASLSLVAFYVDHGYVMAQARARPPKPSQGPVVFDITEGGQFRIGKVAIAGLPAMDAARELAKLKARHGDIFARNVVGDDRDALYQRIGRWVSERTVLDKEHKTIDVTFEVKAAPPWE